MHTLVVAGSMVMTGGVGSTLGFVDSTFKSCDLVFENYTHVSLLGNLKNK